MIAKPLDALRRDGRLLSPRIGRFTCAVAPGSVLVAGQTLGRIRTAGNEHVVRVPAGEPLRVTEISVKSHDQAVCYEEPLMSASPLQLQDADGASSGAGADASTAASFYVAPMDGQFYRRASPESDPYVEDGQVVSPGDTIGMIEVMKFFYPIQFEGAAPRRFVEFLVGDGVPVSSDQHIARIEVP